LAGLLSKPIDDKKSIFKAHFLSLPSEEADGCKKVRRHVEFCKFENDKAVQVMVDSIRGSEAQRVSFWMGSHSTHTKSESS
jgi:hypothetical protein